jgi:hypothetical protein
MQRSHPDPLFTQSAMNKRILKEVAELQAAGLAEILIE